MFRLFWADESGLPADDRGLAYGDGLFETIRMVEQKGVLLSRHLERMVRDAGRLGIEVSRRDLANVCVQAAQRFAGRFRGGRLDSQTDPDQGQRWAGLPACSRDGAKPAGVGFTVASDAGYCRRGR